MTAVVTQRLDQMCSTNGDGTGTIEMATSADSYTIAPPANHTYDIVRLNIYIQDNGAFRGDRYGNSSALATGIVVSVDDASGVIRTLTPHAVTKVGEWGLYAGVDVFNPQFSLGDDIFIIRWTFEKAGFAIKLSGDNGEFLNFNVQDNLGGGGAGLVSHMALVQGVQRWTG